MIRLTKFTKRSTSRAEYIRGYGKCMYGYTFYGRRYNF